MLGLTKYLIDKFDFSNRIGDFVEKEMATSINKYGVTPSDTKAWDTTQQTLKCCGIFNSSDWQQHQLQQQQLPDSCQRSSIPVNVSFLSESEYYSDGCAEKVTRKLVDDLFIIIGTFNKYDITEKLD